KALEFWPRPSAVATSDATGMDSRERPEQAQASQIDHDLTGRKSDDIAVRTDDALDQKRAQALRGVGPRLVEPLPARGVAHDFVLGGRAQADFSSHGVCRANHRRSAGQADRVASVDDVRTTY